MEAPRQGQQAVPRRPVYSQTVIEAKRFMFHVRTTEGARPLRVEIDFLPSHSEDDGPVRIKIGRSSDGQRSIGWMKRPERDIMPALHRVTLPGIIDLFPGGSVLVKDYLSPCLLLMGIVVLLFGFLYSPTDPYVSRICSSRGIRVRDPHRDLSIWSWNIEVKSLFAEPGAVENPDSFHPQYADLFHKYTHSVEPPLVGDLMAAVARFGYSSQHVLMAPPRYAPDGKSFDPAKFFHSLSHALDMVRPHRAEFARLSHSTEHNYPLSRMLTSRLDDVDHEFLQATVQRVSDRWVLLRGTISKSMPKLFDQLNQLGDGMAKTVGQPDANSKVINLFERFLSPHNPIHKFPDELDKHLHGLTRDVGRIKDALDLPTEILTLLKLDKIEQNKPSLEEILSEGPNDPIKALKYLEDLRALPTLSVMLLHLHEAHKDIRLEKLSLKYNSLRAQSMQKKTVPTMAWWKGCWMRECLPPVAEMVESIKNGTAREAKKFNEVAAAWSGSVMGPSRG